jgi:serine protease Do
MVERNSRWVSLLFGLGCVALGAALGVAWPCAVQQPWTEAAPLRRADVLPSFADVVKRIEGGVVTVRAVRDLDATATAAAPENVGGLRAVHAGRAGIRSGSGFVVAARGLVVTCRHVVVDAIDIHVIVPSHGLFEAELMGEDRATDLALLRLRNAPADLPALPLATRNELQAGDWIVAVGNPFGYAQTVTAGVVSFVGRHLAHSDFGVTNDFLQISAPVNPGSSGCPVVDLHGRVVGLTTQAPADAQGISFAVPSRTVKWTLDQIQRAPDGRVRRGFLGIEFASRGGVDAQGARLPGAVITQVMEGQPAHRAGVRTGDVVLRIDGVPVADATSLHERIVCSPPGTKVALDVLRSGHVDATEPVVAVLGEIGSRDGSTPN